MGEQTRQMVEVASGVFTVEHRVAEGKNGIVLGGTRALAIDTGTDPEEGAAMAEFIRARGFEVTHLVLTHGHNDHVLGGAAFRDAEVFAHADTPGRMRYHLPRFAAQAGRAESELVGQIPWPTVTFQGELRIDLGGKSAHLLPAPGHSPDGIVVYLPEDRVLFAGDVVVTAIIPALWDGNSQVMEASLRRLAAMDVEVLVAGHGAPLYGQAQIQSWLAWLMAYLAGVRGKVRELVEAGVPAAEIVEQVDYATWVGDRLPRDRHNMPKRHRDTVMCIIEEERL